MRRSDVRHAYDGPADRSVGSRHVSRENVALNVLGAEARREEGAKADAGDEKSDTGGRVDERLTSFHRSARAREKWGAAHSVRSNRKCGVRSRQFMGGEPP